MVDKMDILERVIAINNQILTYEKFLEYAKDSETITSLCDDILALRVKKDIYLNLI